MRASAIDKKFSGEFETTQKIEAGDSISVVSIAQFVSKNEGYKGVVLTDNIGKKYHTLAAQPVGFLTTDAIDWLGLIEKSKGEGVDIFFSQVLSNTTKRPMLHASLYPSK